MNSHDAIVIGAGQSGLAAAHTLITRACARWYSKQAANRSAPGRTTTTA